MSEGPNNSDDLKNELDIVFKAVWTQQLIDNTPEYEGRADLIGTPIFYDSAGNLDVEFVSKKMGVSAEVVRVSHESWLAAGNKPPIRKAVASRAPSTVVAPSVPSFEPTPIEPAGSSTIRDATTHYQEVAALNHARNQYEASQATGMHGNVMPMGATSDQLLTTLITELVRSNSNNKGDSDSLVMLKLLESQERNSERSRQDQAMMMNAMNQNQTQMMGLVIDSMRNGGGRSTTDETLIGMALDGLRTGSSGPEESVLDSLIRSGQLAEITGSIATGLKSVMSARSPPVGAPPNYSIPQAQPIQEQYVEQPPQHWEQPAPQQMPEISFEDKCKAVMQQIHGTLPDQWKANDQFIEILKRSTERSVMRAEEMFPASVQNQMERSIMELLIVVNLRLLGMSVQNINKGMVSIEMAGNIVRDHDLWVAFQHETYDSLIEIITSYADCDAPGQKNLAYDIEFLSAPENRQVIEGVLAAAKGV
mgnify:CR=1 FL=1|tara:strand:- start:222 stop:1655 length:1434 start_codon:yes stop_codon:yes gene_type:complete